MRSNRRQRLIMWTGTASGVLGVTVNWLWGARSLWLGAAAISMIVLGGYLTLKANGGGHQGGSRLQSHAAKTGVIPECKAALVRSWFGVLTMAFGFGIVVFADHDPPGLPLLVSVVLILVGAILAASYLGCVDDLNRRH